MDTEKELRLIYRSLLIELVTMVYAPPDEQRTLHDLAELDDVYGVPRPAPGNVTSTARWAWGQLVRNGWADGPEPKWPGQ